MTMENENLVEAMKAVVAEAKKDGKITQDEYNLLIRISVDTAEYTMALEKASEDGVIDEEEEKMLAKLRKKIMKNAKNLAETDSEVTKDEFNLLLKLSDVLEK